MPAPEAVRPTSVDPISEVYDLRSFDCGDEEINNYLRTQARPDHLLKRTSTWILHHVNDSTILAFITIAMGHIQMKLDGITHESPIGSLHVAYVGRDVRFGGGAIGRYMVKWAIHRARTLSADIGCRGVHLNCYEDRLPFYRDIGFDQYGKVKKDPDTGKPRYALFFDLVNPAPPLASDGAAAPRERSLAIAGPHAARAAPAPVARADADAPHPPGQEMQGE